MEPSLGYSRRLARLRPPASSTSRTSSPRSRSGGRRSQSRVAGNPTSDVRDITTMAFAAPEPLQHRILTLLGGVRVPTATALLTVGSPTSTPSSTSAARRRSPASGSGTAKVASLTYLDVCRRLAKRLSVDLRTLDRALWRWSKDGHPER